MGFQLLLGVEGSQVSLLYFFGFYMRYMFILREMQEHFVGWAFLFKKENCFPLIKLEFIPLKLTCRRAQQAGKDSPAGPGNSSNAPVNCSWTRKNSTSHNSLTDSACALKCLCFSFYGCGSWSHEIPVAFQLPFLEKERGKVSTSNCGRGGKRGPPGLKHEKVNKGVSSWHSKLISGVPFWVLASWFWETTQKLVMLQQVQALLFRAIRSIMQVIYTGDQELNAHLRCIIPK